MLIEQIVNKLANSFPDIQIETNLSMKSILEILEGEFKCENCKHYMSPDYRTTDNGNVECRHIEYSENEEFCCKYFELAPNKLFYNAPCITLPTTTSHDSTYSTTKPEYYKSGDFDVIEFCNTHQLGFCEGNIIKYLVRNGKKNSETKLEDLNKAKEYLERLIKYYDKNE